MRDKEMIELLSVRVPYGASEMMSDVASKLGLTRSEFMRRAFAHYIEASKASSNAASAG